MLTWADRTWRAEQWRDGWRVSHGTRKGGYGGMRRHLTWDQMVAYLLDQGVDPVEDLDTEEPRRPR